MKNQNLEDQILELIKASDEMTFSDLQACLSAILAGYKIVEKDQND